MMGITGRRRRDVALVALMAIAAVFTVAVSPASASGSHPSAPTWSCWLEFSATNLLFQGASGARGAGGGVPREPDHGLAEEVPAWAQGKGGKNFRATVPVWFHVVHDGAIANLTQEQIEAQIGVLNTTFAGGEGGYDTGFTFKLAGVTRTDNGEWLRHGFGDKTERDMKRALHRGGRDTLNIYSTEASIYLGWAYFPNLPDARLYLDGVVIDWESFLGTSDKYEGKYDQGETTTHETGHWLNLYHVFQGGCNHWGDYVDDTPPQKTATNGCPEGQDSCKEPGIDSIHNYMDYLYDSCYTEFTAGQTARMQDAWLHFRANG